MQHRVAHDVADVVHPAGNPLVLQVVHRHVGGAEKEAGNPVGQDPVEFLRHRHVEGTQPRFHMDDRDEDFGGGQGPCQGGIGVPVNHQVVRLLLEQDVFDPHHHGRRLLRMAA